MPTSGSGGQTPLLEAAAAVVRRCISLLPGPSATWTHPGGYPDGLALCIIDSVQSTGVKYGSVRRVAERYRNYRMAQDGEPASDGADVLLTTFAELGGPEAWAGMIGNQNKTSSARGAPLKALAIRDAAAGLVERGVVTAGDFRAAVADEAEAAEVRQGWCGVIGQASGVTWHYVQMLAGVPGVKPDRMIIRFVADALEQPTSRVGRSFAVDVVSAAAVELGVEATTLDHVIWQWQRKQGVR